MLRKWISSRKLYSGVVLAILMSACGDSESPPEPVTVSGIVTKAPVTGADVEIFVLASNGDRGERVAGPVKTDGNGQWSTTIPGDGGDHFLVVSSAGSYLDEATNTTLTFASSQQLVGYLHRSQPQSVVVSPFSLSIHEMAGLLISRGVGAGAAWQLAIDTFAQPNAFGFDLTTTIPSTTNDALNNQKAYVAVLGGLSTLIEAGLNPGSAQELVLAYASDMSDGKFDGLDALGNPIQIAGGTLAPVDNTGLAPLFDAAEAYASSKNLEVDLPPLVILPLLPCEQARLIAYTSLENKLFEILNGPDPQAPHDVDLTEPRMRYKEVLNCNPNDPEAHLALALLDLAVLSTDAEINNAFDEWELYLDNNTPFETDARPEFRVYPGFSEASLAMGMTFDMIRRNLMPYTELGSQPGVPQLSRIQDIFEEKVLPLAISGVEHMNVVVANTLFEFTLSPRMQGDLMGDIAKADHTDFLALRASLNALQAACHTAVAYEVSLSAYDGPAVVAAMHQTNGTLLKLRAGGRGHMQSVTAALLAAAADVDAGITSLLAEDPLEQDYDILKVDPDPQDRMDLENFRTGELNAILQSLQGPYTYTYDWDSDPFTPEAPLTVNLAAFFANPVADWKVKSPPYTITVTPVLLDSDYFYESSMVSVNVNVPTTGTVSGLCEVYYSNFVEYFSNCSGPAWLVDALSSVVEQELAAINNWAGYASIRATFSGDVTTGPAVLSVQVNLDYEANDTWVDIPVITFNADTYAQWCAGFPDPKMNGLLPDATSACEILDLLGMRAGDWVKVLELDWTD